MAEDKKSFILYADSYGLIKQLPDEIAGKLLKHIFAYVNDENPETDNLLVNIAFEPIKQQLKRDLQKWESHLNGKSNSGKLGNLKRWHNDLYLQVIKNEIDIENALFIANNRKVSHSDNVQSQTVANIAVNDNVSVNVNVNDIKDNTLTSNAEKIDFQKLQQYWNLKCKNTLVPEIKVFSKTRQNKIKTLVAKYGKDEIIKAINKLFESDFCTGKNGNWKADFDFLCQQSSFIKLIEGSYSNNKHQQNDKPVYVPNPKSNRR